MKAALTALALAASCPPAALAADHSGAWVSVHDKSHWSNGQFPKDFKLTIQLTFTPGKVVYKSVNTTNPDIPRTVSYEAALDGTPTPRPGSERYDRISWRQRNADEFEVLELKGQDDVIVGTYWTFLPDGKTLVRRGVGKDPQGVSKFFEEWFVKQ